MLFHFHHYHFPRDIVVVWIKVIKQIEWKIYSDILPLFPSCSIAFEDTCVVDVAIKAARDVQDCSRVDPTKLCFPSISNFSS